MEYVTHRSRRVDTKVSLAKGFEMKLLGCMITDLERTMNENYMDPANKKALIASFDLAKKAVRGRDPVVIASLASSLSTQCTLERERNVYCINDGLPFYIQYQLGAFLKKFPFPGIDTNDPALQKFEEAELSCKRFNSENYRALERMDKTFHATLGGCLDEIRRDIEHLLGAEPNVPGAEVGADHGPGVSLGPLYKAGKSTSYYKWSTLPYSVTRDALPYAKQAIENDPRWIGALDQWYRKRCNNLYGPIDVADFWQRIFLVVPGSRITVVPKTALTGRTIAIEPLMNVYLQLGLEKLMRRALLKWGIDINQQETNQKLAFRGALTGDFCTLDLSSASDTIALQLCLMLLPPAWSNLLLDLRSPTGVLQGKEVHFEKISSMGNGFTFALETIVFGALTRHVMRRLRISGKEMAVFGDDIVCPTEAAKPLIELLEYCGFHLNIDKSFINGPFRESCGRDYFLGEDVRPVFLKRELLDVRDLFYVHNALYAKERALNWTWGVHFTETRKLIRKHIPKSFGKLYGPISETEDAYLFSSRKLPGIGQHRWHLQLVSQAITFNRKTDFFFRKLMGSLKGPTAAEKRWDLKRRLTTGNSFDVTRRDSVRVKCTKKRVWL